MNRFYIYSMTLIGIRKNYGLTFKPGLNCISGPTSTGKTSILEMIDYALGAKKHKSYIEIGEACTDVELEFSISGNKYRLRRRLFEFDLPVRIDEWNEEEKIYKYLDTLDVDIPSNEHSLSAFIMGKLGLSEVKVANQCLSFRDIVKYSYLKQTDIDSENIMGELDWIKNLKRRASFEIIYNIYDEMLASLNNKLKTKRDELEEAKTKLEGVEQFLKTTELGGISEYRKQRTYLEEQIESLESQLRELKQSEKLNISSNLNTEKLRNNILNDKFEITKLEEQQHDQEEYIEKLKLLSNQYQNDIIKSESVLLGYVEINKYEFVVCPNCLKPLGKQHSGEKCGLCGNGMSDRLSDLIRVKKDIKTYRRRHSELSKHIEGEEEKFRKLVYQTERRKKNLREEENELYHLQQGYMDPFIEQIEYINYEIGKNNRQLEELDMNLKMLEEHERLRKLQKNREDDIAEIRKNISKLKTEHNEKHEIVQKVSTKYNEVLNSFKFPKLDFGYIKEKTYLPYARNRKYSDLGSLGGVSLLVIAYYLSILITTIDKERFFHLNFLMMDSPRKNLGANANQEDFRDEEIFNSIIRKFIEIDKKYKDDLQLIVVNNGFPAFLPEECMRVEFAANGLKGLIDDAP